MFDQHPQRICILQRPVAVKHAKVKDEPIKDRLGNINSFLIQRIVETRYGGDYSKIPYVNYLGEVPAVVSTPLFVQRTEKDGDVSFMLSNPLPDVSSWLKILAGPSLTWLRALLTSSAIVQGTSYIENLIRRLLAPRPQQKAAVKFDGSSPASLVAYGSYGQHKVDFRAVEITFDNVAQHLDVTLFEDHCDFSVPLYL